MKLMTDIPLSGKRVLIREDLNVPIHDGVVINAARIIAAIPTLQAAMAAGGRVMVLSHLGRPKEGEYDPAYSLKPVAEHLSSLLGQEVGFAGEWIDGVDVEPGHMVLCENVRFNCGEKSDDEALSHRLAALCDVFVMDAFGSSHRAHASTHGVARFAPIACAGPLLAREIDALNRALADPKHPVVAIVGGAKVSSKFGVLKALVDQVDILIPGGGIANTFLAARDVEIGDSLYESDWIDSARDVLQQAQARGSEILLPVDVAVTQNWNEQTGAQVKDVGAIGSLDKIGDIGPRSAEKFRDAILRASTIIWNGPLGVFEWDAFVHGTEALARAIAKSDAFSLAGGGETITALEQFELEDKISYISTGGGAFLEFIEKRALPGIEVLESKDKTEYN